MFYIFRIRFDFRFEFLVNNINVSCVLITFKIWNIGCVHVYYFYLSLDCLLTSRVVSSPDSSCLAERVKITEKMFTQFAFFCAHSERLSNRSISICPLTKHCRGITLDLSICLQIEHSQFGSELDQSLMIGRRKHSLYPERVSSVFTFVSVCVQELGWEDLIPLENVVIIEIFKACDCF